MLSLRREKSLVAHNFIAGHRLQLRSGFSLLGLLIGFRTSAYATKKARSGTSSSIGNDIAQPFVRTSSTKISLLLLILLVVLLLLILLLLGGAKTDPSDAVKMRVSPQRQCHFAGISSGPIPGPPLQMRGFLRKNCAPVAGFSAVDGI